MRKEIIELCKEIRKYDDSEALDWLKINFPYDDKEKRHFALEIIPHRSWKKESLKKLIEHYCAVSGSAFFVLDFLSFMNLYQFITYVRPFIPSEPIMLDRWRYEFSSKLMRYNHNSLNSKLFLDFDKYLYNLIKSNISKP